MCTNLSLKNIYVITILKLAVLTAVMIFNFSIYVMAAVVNSGSCGDNVTYILDDEGNLIISGSGKMSSYYSSDPPWYDYIEDIVSVTIEKGVESIGNCAFKNCDNLTNISIPDSITNIGSSVFYGCKSLASVDLPSGITTISSYTFYDCRNLTSIEIPSGVTSIGSSAFYKCINLTSIEIPNGVTTMGNSTFYGCTSLTSINLPSELKQIGNWVFYRCSNLTNIVIPNRVSSIGNWALYQCSGLENIEIPDSVESIGEGAFDCCSNLTSIELPSGITSIETYTFCACSNLISIELPNGLTNIGGMAFYDCTALPTIIIPNSVTSIGNSAFAYCSNLADIEIPNNVTSIGNSAFAYCINLADIELPDYITNIEDCTFNGCINLTSITIPDGVTTIGEYAFSGCLSLEKIVLVDTVYEISKRAFTNCPSLKTVYYTGNSDEWNEISISIGNENLLNADIIYLYQTDSESGVDIYSSNVLGGIKITLSSDNAQTIYYTTDGTIPTTRSKVYEKPFTLTESGSYTIETMAYDGTAYSDIAVSSIELSKLSKPSINCNNGVVTITAEDDADIYYNYSLTPPTTSSNIYNEAFAVSTSVYISAVAIKAGYAKSNTAILYCTGNEEKEDYQPLTDSYSFSNVKESFGYSITYKIPKSSYISVFGETLGSALYNVYAYTDSGSLKFWKGSCFGMALTSMLFYANGLTPSEYCSSDYDRLYDVSAPASADASLTKLIERCQVSQFLPIIQTEMSNEEEDGGNWVQSGFGDLSGILSAAQNCSNEPVIFYISRLKDDDIYGHAVLPYRVENSDDDLDVFYVYIYDCDIPNNEDGKENYITINLSENTFLYNGIDTYDYAISFVKISSLIDNDTVSLLEDDDVENNASVMTDNFLFITNSNDVSIYNTNGIEVENISGAVKYGTMGIEDTTGIMWLLPDDDYTVVNNDSSISQFKVNVVDEVDSFTLTTDDLSAEISFGRYSDRLYISSSSDSEANITIDTYNSTKKENSISLCSDYIYVKPYNDNIIELYTNTDTITANNIEFSLDTYSGSFVKAKYMLLINKNAALGVEKDCEISVISKPQINSNTFLGTLKLNLVNNGEVSESGTLYIALYDEDSNKILTEQSKAVSSLIPGESRNITFDFDCDLSETAEEYVLKIMFWNEYMQPISDFIVLTY